MLASGSSGLRASGAIRMETTGLCPVAGLPMRASGRLYIVYGDCSWGNFLTQRVQIFIYRKSTLKKKGLNKGRKQSQDFSQPKR